MVFLTPSSVNGTARRRSQNVRDHFAVNVPAKGPASMKTILHIGAHRTGSTSFQTYMRRHAADLREGGLAYWGPFRTRKGLFSGILPGKMPGLLKDTAARARGRIALQRIKAEEAGVQTLLISDENMLGTARKCMITQRLYPDVGLRMARFAEAFDHQIDRVVLTVRAQDLWWRSAGAYAVTRGMGLPSAKMRAEIAQSLRGWRDVVTELACALPEETEIMVLPFESFAGRSDAMLQAVAGVEGPAPLASDWLNKAPSAKELGEMLQLRGDPQEVPADESGRWQAFGEEEAAALRELYEDDMFWLRAGADGLATLTEDPGRRSSQEAMGLGAIERGQPYVTERRQLAQPG